MTMSLRLLIALLIMSFLPLCAQAAPPVSYSRQILPLLRKECQGCHGGTDPASGYSMETRELLIKGGRHGAAILVGKGAQSNLVRYMTGDLQPKMPPGGAMDLDRIALIRRWIDEGAKVDSSTMPVPKPDAPQLPTLSVSNRAGLPAPVTALVFSPDGKTLAVGGYRVVRLLNPANGAVVRIVPGAADQIQGLAWSGDGRFLAASGGVPGQSGEVVIFDAQTWKPVQRLIGHTEVVYAVAWKPGASEIATGSLDKTARIWNTESGQCIHIIKDHADAVFGVAYSPDGKLLATGSADRSVKLFDTASWKRLAVLNAHEDAVTHVAFNQAGTLLATAGADKSVRIWAVKIGAMENPLRTQNEGDTINSCAFSSNGDLLVWGASNHVVKVFNGDGSKLQHEMKEAQDWVYSVAIGRDNLTVVAGTQDGKVLFWDAKEGRLIRSVTLMPAFAKLPDSREHGR